MTRPFRTLLWIGVLLLAAQGGCVYDLVCPLSQGVLIRVTSRETGQPLKDAQVTIALRDRPIGNTEILLLSDEEYLEEYARATGLTDDNGETDLPDERHEFCGSGVFPFLVLLRPLPDPLPDYVTRESYLVRVESDQGSEILMVQMTPGLSEAGELYAVEVVSVSETIEIDPRDADE